MSDTLIAIIVNAVSAIILAWMNMKTNKKLATTNAKVDNYHKEVNGRMGEFIGTAKELGEKIGKEKEQQNPTTNILPVQPIQPLEVNIKLPDGVAIPVVVKGKEEL